MAKTVRIPNRRGNRVPDTKRTHVRGERTNPKSKSGQGFNTNVHSKSGSVT